MAGTSKSYWRKKSPGTPTVKQAINSQGKLESYNEWDLYLYNPSNDTAVMNVSGMVTSNPGVDTEYIGQNPGVQYQATTTVIAINSYGEEESYQIWNRTPERINQTTITTTGINSYGEEESYEIWNGTSGFQINHPNPSISDKF